jgi:hypothetical protein
VTARAGFLVLLASSGVAGVAGADEYLPLEKAGDLADPRLKEVSGLARVTGRPRYYWVHNDSGDGPRIFAIHETGKVIAEVAVTGAAASDWEDIANGPGPLAGRPYLYIADTGNNKLGRNRFTIYRLEEPELPALDPGQKFGSAPADRIRFRYPDGTFDCEAMAVHPGTGTIYLATKMLTASYVYALDPGGEEKKTRVARKVGTLRPRFYVTGADIALDGRRFLVRTYFGVEEYRLPAGQTDFEEVFSQRLVALPSPRNELIGEAIAYDHEGTGYVTASEVPKVLHRARRQAGETGKAPEKAPPSRPDDAPEKAAPGNGAGADPGAGKAPAGR